MFFCEKSKYKKIKRQDLPILKKKANFAPENAYTAHGEI